MTVHLSKGFLSKPGIRFFWLLLCTVFGSCSAYVGMVLQGVTYADVVALSRIPFHQDGYYYLPVRLSASAFTDAQGWICILAVALLLLALLGVISSPGRREVRALVAEAKASGARLCHGMRQLSPRQRQVAGLALGLLTVSRLYFSVVYPYQTDEVASYDFFISRGLLAVSSFYPIPNNHILNSTLSWVFYGLNTSPWFVLRLPVLFTATAGTVLLFVGVLRLTSFGTAMVMFVIFGWMQESLYYATAGRGYWLLILGGGLSFLAVTALLDSTRPARLGWVLLLLSGVLGCYTMPPFVYVVASATGCLGWCFLRRRAWADMSRTIAVGSGIAVSAAILYTPILLVSGWQSLFANRYVVATSWSEVVWNLPKFIWSTEGRLLGHRGIGALLLVLALALVTHFWKPYRSAPPISSHPPAGQELVGPIMWFLWLPYAMMLVQSVIPPYRVLVYKGLFGALLWGLLAERWAQRSQNRRQFWLVAVLLVSFAGYQCFVLARSVEKAKFQDKSRLAAFAWLARQPPGRVLVGKGEMGLYLLFFAHQQVPRRSWQFDSTPQSGVRYRYVILSHEYQESWYPVLLTKPAYEDENLMIYNINI
ncbi:hypothetical protein [Hymenobacter sp. IS2118]|uniref:hypothetical protein n=1 Tax=Hymenobacter sp. IS2118 TaxID=1505605 RepID=UPI0012694E40|nr:hypothetical protein [Hymenobacter sp. IS2118]